MILYGLGPFEITLTLILLSYVCYNSYVLWRSSAGDMEYGEEQ